MTCHIIQVDLNYTKSNFPYKNWFKKSQDLRYFKMHFSRRKDLTGTRKVGKCIGNLYCTFHDCPLSFLQKEKGTLPTFRMQMATRFASAVEI